MKTSSAKETSALAQKIAEGIINKKYFRIIALVGDLGAGKTTFTQAFAKALGVRKKILSPTFLIMKRFPLVGTTFENMYHVDAYRVGREDLEKLGIVDIFKGNNIVLIEWADRVKKLLPKETTWIQFSHGKSENEREIIIN